jgi:hypothetical protein
MMMGVPSDCDIFSLTMRATASAPPPGATGTISLMTLFGKALCAWAQSGSASNRAASGVVRQAMARRPGKRRVMAGGSGGGQKSGWRRQQAWAPAQAHDNRTAPGGAAPAIQTAAA